MWNYSFTVPNIILLSVFLLFYCLQPHLPISKNRSFLRILCVEIIVTALDISASLLLEDYKRYPPRVHIVLNTLFFVAFILRTLFFYHFTDSLFVPKSQRKISGALLHYSPVSLILLVVCANFFSPTVFSIDETGYHRAAWYNIIYVSAFFYLSLSLYTIIANRKKVNRLYVFGSLAVNFILLVGYIARILFPRILIMDYFCLVAVVVIYMTFENASFYLENRTGAFNMESLSALLDEKAGDSNTLILGILLHNYNDMREIYSGTQIDKGIALISDYFRHTYPSLSRFYISSGRFVLVGSGGDTEKMKSEIRERFTAAWKCEEMELYLDVRFVELHQDCRIDRADKLLHALLSAFNSVGIIGDNDVIISSETLKILEKNTEIKRAVRSAVENKSVEMFLQPLVDVNTHKVVGAEALARLRDADGSLLPPNVFIPVAEKNGHINSLGEQVFEKACEFVRDNDLEAMGISWINVNLSPLQFLRSDLTSRFESILEKYGVSAEKIHLEITEEAMIDYALLQKQIQSMKHTGFEFVLDDFGSGYSNVTRLKQYPFINIKLDMEIVWDYFKNRDQILPALVNAFKHMGFTVTAEGIETKEMAAEMKWLGCDYLQGFYFSRPLPAEEFAERYGEGELGAERAN